MEFPILPQEHIQGREGLLVVLAGRGGWIKVELSEGGVGLEGF